MRNCFKIKYFLLAIILYVSTFAPVKIYAGSMVNYGTSDTLYSPTISTKFYEIAQNIANSDETTYIENEIAISFLLAARELDNNNSEISSLLLKCICRFPQQNLRKMNAQGRNYFELVNDLLRDYVNNESDITLACDSVVFLLNQIETSAQKQILLEQLIKNFENKSPVFTSELLIMIASLKEQENLPEEAEKYYRQAYQSNKHNRFAFSRLFELSRSKISPVEYLERLCLDLQENPIDLNAALTLSRVLDGYQLYDEAALSYEYSADLFAYLYPTESLPVDICLPWSISCYNSRQHTYKCIEIAESIRETGKFDIRLESLAGRAAGKLGNDELAIQILRDTEKKAIELLDKDTIEINAVQLAWFYSFVLPMPDKAMEWSNKAFAANSKSAVEASLLAYSLVQKKEYDTAKAMLSQFQANQISELTLAKIQLEEGDKDLAIEILYKAIGLDPGSFEAEQAKDILAQNGSQYIQSENADIILANLKRTFGINIVPVFTNPETMFSVALNIRSKELSFGSELDSAISIVNKSSIPLVINDNGLLKGKIRIDALVNGDLSRKITHLVSQSIGNSETIEPGKSKIVSIQLITGELRELLLSHPQASFNITFVLYLDPVTTAEDKVANGLTKLEPVLVNIKRPGMTISGQNIRNLVDSISNTQIGQKIQSAQLFIGLLKEQNTISTSTSPYRTVFTDGMKTLLKSALIYDSGLLKNSETGSWVVKVYTMSELLNYSMDYELLNAVSDNLYSADWPVRMMALYLLSENQGDKFVKVIEAISRSEKHQLVKDIAMAEMEKIRSENSL